MSTATPNPTAMKRGTEKGFEKVVNAENMAVPHKIQRGSPADLWYDDSVAKSPEIQCMSMKKQSPIYLGIYIKVLGLVAHNERRYLVDLVH